ncbi:MAG: hypothetical protein J1E01_08755 [Acetatifactor sp.]|nr:hypothetical protein [Acetatifactor sp.]
MDILLTAFKGTSSELLIQGSKYNTLLLPSNKKKDIEILISVLQKHEYDYIMSFGQRPIIKDKVCIETTAQNANHKINTTADCIYLIELFEKSGVPAKLSHNAGTSFCNNLYWHGLSYLAEQNLKTKMIFIHVPFTKNIKDITDFSQKISNVMCLIANDF